jgi:hypothetical protein
MFSTEKGKSEAKLLADSVEVELDQNCYRPGELEAADRR